MVRSLRSGNGPLSVIVSYGVRARRSAGSAALADRWEDRYESIEMTTAATETANAAILSAVMATVSQPRRASRRGCARPSTRLWSGDIPLHPGHVEVLFQFAPVEP